MNILPTTIIVGLFSQGADLRPEEALHRSRGNWVAKGGGSQPRKRALRYDYYRATLSA